MPRYEDTLTKHPLGTSGWLVGVSEDERDALVEAVRVLRPFAENWDFHSADYLAADSGKRVVDALGIEDMARAINSAREILARLDKLVEGR